MKAHIGVMLFAILASASCKTIPPPPCKAPTQVEIELQTYSVPTASFADLPRDQLLEPTGWAQLKAAGKAELTSTLVVLTEEGEQTTIKSVKEWRYPQSYEPDSEGKPRKEISVNIPVTVFAPADFQTREVGYLFNITPTLGVNDIIRMTLVPEINGEPTWEDFGASLTGSDKKSMGAQMKQPIFATATLTSKIFVRNGKRIILGACPAPFDPKKTLVFVIGARIIR